MMMAAMLGWLNGMICYICFACLYFGSVLGLSHAMNLSRNTKYIEMIFFIRDNLVVLWYV